VKVISTDHPPSGAGGDGVALVAGAVGNAAALARLRELPFEPERVRGALGRSADGHDAGRGPLGAENIFRDAIVENLSI
jgi:hypothetical protein